MKSGALIEIIAVIILVIADFGLIIYIVFSNSTEIPIVLGLVFSIISTISTYIATRILSFRYNLGQIDLLAIELIEDYQKKNSMKMPLTEFLSDLEVEIGPTIPKKLYEDLKDRGIIKTEMASIKISGPPKGISVVDTTWRAYLI